MKHTILTMNWIRAADSFYWLLNRIYSARLGKEAEATQWEIHNRDTQLRREGRARFEQGDSRPSIFSFLSRRRHYSPPLSSASITSSLPPLPSNFISLPHHLKPQSRFGSSKGRFPPVEHWAEGASWNGDHERTKSEQGDLIKANPWLIWFFGQYCLVAFPFEFDSEIFCAVMDVN